MADPTAPSDEGTRADILRWAAHQLRQVPVECTALTGPVWYGEGWKDATDHLELLADGEARTPGAHDERSPLYEQLAAAVLTVPIRLGPATIRNAQAGQNVTRLSGSEADHAAQVVMDVLANRANTPRERYDPRTEAEAHWGGEPEQLIAAWKADRVQWWYRVRDLEEENQRLRKQSDQRWTAWRSACARAKEARENEQMERYFAREFGGDVIRLRRQLTQTGDWRDAYNELCSRLAFHLGMVNPTVAGDREVEERIRDLNAGAETAREAGRRWEGIPKNWGAHPKKSG